MTLFGDKQDVDHKALGHVVTRVLEWKVKEAKTTGRKKRTESESSVFEGGLKEEEEEGKKIGKRGEEKSEGKGGERRESKGEGKSEESKREEGKPSPGPSSKVSLMKSLSGVKWKEEKPLEQGGKEEAVVAKEEDAEDTMKNLRRTFAGIFGDM